MPCTEKIVACLVFASLIGSVTATALVAEVSSEGRPAPLSAETMLIMQDARAVAIGLAQLETR